MKCRTDGRNNKAPSIAGGAWGSLRCIYLSQPPHDPPEAVVVVRVRFSAAKFMRPIMLWVRQTCQCSRKAIIECTRLAD